MSEVDTSAEGVERVEQLAKDVREPVAFRLGVSACLALLRALRAERDAALEQANEARSTLSAWFDLAKKAESAGADVLRDAVGTWLRTAMNGGMPREDAELVRMVLDEAARLYLWKALVPVLRTIQDEQRDAAQAERDRLRRGWLITIQVEQGCQPTGRSCGPEGQCPCADDMAQIMADDDARAALEGRSDV